MHHAKPKVVIGGSGKAAHEIPIAGLAKQAFTTRQRLSLTHDATLQIQSEQSFGTWRKRAGATQEKD